MNRSALETAAHFILEQIETPIPGTAIRWSHFWKNPASVEQELFEMPSVLVAVSVPADRFGTYGIIFGVSNLLPRSIYDNFYLSQYRNATQTTAQLILVNLAKSLEVATIVEMGPNQ